MLLVGLCLPLDSQNELSLKVSNPDPPPEVFKEPLDDPFGSWLHLLIDFTYSLLSILAVMLVHILL